MWNLDDSASYLKLVSVRIPRAYTWGSSDREKREEIRRVVATELLEPLPTARWWAFRLYSRKSGDGWDVENIPKLIVDAFSHEQIQRDRSDYPQVGLYARDTVEFVRMVQVAGESSGGEESTVIEIYGAR